MTARLKAELELAWNATSEAEALAEARAHALAAAEKRIHILEGAQPRPFADFEGWVSGGGVGAESAAKARLTTMLRGCLLP